MPEGGEISPRTIGAIKARISRCVWPYNARPMGSSGSRRDSNSASAASTVIAPTPAPAGEFRAPRDGHAPMTRPSASPAPERGGRRSSAILITGAGGEVGHGLIEAMHGEGRTNVVAIDIRDLPEQQRRLCQDTFVGDICDASLLERLLAMYEITEMYHLAALLSTRGEFAPEAAHEVNVNGTVSLLKLAAEQARSHGQRVKFIFPSSIAVYGMPSLDAKRRAGAVREDEFCLPITMYGCNKLYCEHLGRYYSHHYRLLAKDRVPEV